MVIGLLGCNDTCERGRLLETPWNTGVGGRMRGFGNTCVSWFMGPCCKRTGGIFLYKIEIWCLLQLQSLNDQVLT